MNLNRMLIGAVLAMCIANANAQYWLTNGLVAHYPFNGNASDATVELEMGAT